MGEPVMKEPVKIVVGVTGGSGAVYALALLRQLRILECETMKLTVPPLKYI